MPKVGKKYYPYTVKGKKDAMRAVKKSGMKMTVGRMTYKKKK